MDKMENTYLKLRKHLDSMGFIQPMSLDSLSLVQNLLQELSYLQNKPFSNKEDVTVEPSLKFANYRSRIAYLLKNVCELNEANLILKNEKEEENKIFKNRVAQLEEINANYKFRESQLNKSIKNFEKEGQEKTKLLLKLEEINLKAIIQTPGGNKAQIPFRREKLAINSFLQNSTFKPNLSNMQADSNLIDIFIVAEKQIYHLTKKVNDSELKRNLLEQQILKLDLDIKVKQDLLNSFTDKFQNAPGIKINLDKPCELTNMHQVGLDKLDNEMDRSRQRNISSVPSSLTSSLNSLLEGNMNSNKRYTDSFLQKLVQQVEDLKIKYIDLKDYLNSLEKGKSISNLKILEKEAETMELIRELEKIGEQTGTLRNTLLEQQKNQQHLNSQDGRDQSSTVFVTPTPVVPTSTGQSGLISQTEPELAEAVEKDSSQEDREEGVGEKDIKVVPKSSQEILKEREKEFERVTKLYRRNLESKSNLSFRINQLLKHEKELLQELEKLHHKTFARTTGYSNSIRESIRLKMEMVIGDLEKDRDHYREEYQFLLQYLDTYQPNVLSKKSAAAGRISMKHLRFSSDLDSPGDNQFLFPPEGQVPGEKVKHSTAKGAVDSTAEFSALEKVIKDKEDLHSLYTGAVDELKHFKALYNGIVQDKRKLEQDYEDLHKEIQNLKRSRAATSHQEKFIFPSTHSSLNRENDIDAIREQLTIANQRFTDVRAENVELRDMVKDNQNTYTVERGELEVQISDLIKMVELLNEDRNALADKCSLLEARASDLKTCIQDTECRLRHSESSVGKERQTTQNLRSEMTKMEENMTADANNKVSVSELQKAHKLIRELDHKLQKIEKERNHNHKLYGGIKDDLDDKERTLVCLHGTLRSLENQVTRLTEELEAKVEELERTKAQGIHEKAAYERNRDGFMEENRILRKDISALTQEHKKLNTNLDILKRDKQQYLDKAEVQLTQLNSLQDILRAKEQEKSGFIEQCNGLERQIQALRVQRKSDEAELNNLRVELASKEAQNMELHENLKEVNIHFKENFTLRLDYERKQEQTKRTMVALETTLKQKESEVSNLSRDVRNLQTACATLQETQESLEQRLKSKVSDSEKLNRLLEEMKRDSESLKVELASRRQSLKTLEEVLSSARKREAQLETENKKSEAKIQRLKKELDDFKLKITNTDFIPPGNPIPATTSSRSPPYTYRGFKEYEINPRINTATQTNINAKQSRDQKDTTYPPRYYPTTSVKSRAYPQDGIVPSAPLADSRWYRDVSGTPLTSPENSSTNTDYHVHPGRYGVSQNINQNRPFKITPTSIASSSGEDSPNNNNNYGGKGR